MSYFILRNGQQYGPYSQAEVQRYLRTGDIYPGDLSRTEEMKQWLAVSHILGSAAPPRPSLVANFDPGYPFAPASAQLPPHLVSVAPPPPGLHWGVLLLLMILTLGLFGWIWSFVIANWVRKIDPRCKAIRLLVFGLVVNIAAAVSLYMGPDTTRLAAAAALFQLVAAVLFVFAIFAMRTSIVGYYKSTENIALSLSGVMTFFFNVLYFQYHFNRIRDTKSTAQLVPAHH
jgi:hypothetical protein